ncbi:MAG: DUF6265 family protein [Woeseiaceae bacterium]
MKTLKFGSRITMAAIILAIPALCPAAEPRTENTYQLAEGEERPAATLDAASFLVGSWVGTAFGERAEESWTAPSGGTMVGTFKLFAGDEPSMYEIMLLSVEDGTLSLKVKHFNADFTAWEEKPDFINFKLVAFSEGELHFGGLSFYQRGDDRIEGYIVMRSGEEVAEMPMVWERVQ